MKAPSYTPPPIDPLIQQSEQQAHRETILGLQERARGDEA